MKKKKKLKSNEISVDGEDHKDYILKVIIKNEDLKEMINDEFFKDWNKDVYVNIDYISANWWNVVDIDSSINIDKDANGWYVEIITDYKEKNENWYGEPYISTKSEKKYLQEGNDVTTFLIL